MVADIENRKEVRDLKANIGGSYEEKQIGRRSKQNIKVQHYTVVKTRDTSNDFLWGNNRCFWNEGLWDNSYTNSLVVGRVILENDVYEEYFINDNFEGGGTATWNTTDNKLEG